MRFCYLDAFSGISGDMTVGALVDAGADAGALISALESLGTGAGFRVEKTKRRGITASKFFVDCVETKKHRHLPHILDLIARSSLSARAKANSERVFRRLGEAEASVHGVPIERVHFHEVGAVDSIADIAGACEALELLGVEGLSCSAINVGSGTVKTEHGILPVPAPATAALLAGTPIYSRGPALELATPTGAALAVTLASSFGTMPAMKISSIGYGAGGFDFPENANVLRALIGETVAVVEATTVTVIEANIDDSTPEVLGYAMDRLFERGALDVTLEPVFMKKNRPGHLLRVIARTEDREMLASVVLAETSTLGLRMYAAERRVQAREFLEVATVHGTVRIKIAADGSFSPEYEDCRKLALASGIPLKSILAEAGRAYLNLAR
jgi:uncharacterized protein (TIGR00299 family) protein